jgi:hypothetical protein
MTESVTTDVSGIPQRLESVRRGATFEPDGDGLPAARRARRVDPPAVSDTATKLPGGGHENCPLAAWLLGHSDGPGKGARFEVILPPDSARMRTFSSGAPGQLIQH